MYCGAGGAITYPSNAQNEWSEVLTKVQSVIGENGIAIWFFLSFFLDLIYFIKYYLFIYLVFLKIFSTLWKSEILYVECESIKIFEIFLIAI